MIQTEKFMRKPEAPVDAVQVTAENMAELAVWCNGDIVHTGENVPYIKVRIYKAMSQRQTQAFVGDWILYVRKGYNVYRNKAFHKNFEAIFQENPQRGNSQEVDNQGANYDLNYAREENPQGENGGNIGIEMDLPVAGAATALLGEDD